MKFTKLTIENWRSFYGRHEITFAGDAERNVTVLVGPNGSGKTALLNAFTWCLFEETTAGFRAIHDLFNHKALDDIAESEEAWMRVRLEFVHDNAEYTIERAQRGFRSSANDPAECSAPQFNATRKQDTEEAITQVVLNQILPPGLHPFFFFPAENIGKEIQDEDTATLRMQMSRAIDVLLGIERYESALTIISRALNKHLKTPRGAKFARIEMASEVAGASRTAWDRVRDRVKTLPKTIALAQQHFNELDHALKRSDESAEIREQYSATRKEADDADEAILRLAAEQREEINRNCAVLFGHELFSNALDVLNKAHSEDLIPPKVTAGLLNELIETRAQCICERELSDRERNILIALRDRTIDDRLTDRATNLRARLPGLIHRNDTERLDRSLASAILANTDEITRYREVRSAAEHRCEELLAERPAIEHGNDLDIRRMWRKGLERLEKLKLELETLKTRLPDLTKQKEGDESKYAAAIKKHEKGQSIFSAREALTGIEKVLSEIQNGLKESARLDVERVMNAFFGPMLFKSYHIRLKEDFNYQVYSSEDDGRPIGVSSSEIALATFAFVRAIAALMPAYSNLEQYYPTDEQSSGVGKIEVDMATAYPVVLDAPFSPFDETYAERFAKQLPNMVPQSILIVRGDQISHLDPIQRDGRIGAAYVFELHTAREPTQQITFGGHRLDYVVNHTDSGSAYTRVARVEV